MLGILFDEGLKLRTKLMQDNKHRKNVHGSTGGLTITAKVHFIHAYYIVINSRNIYYQVPAYYT